MRLSGKTYQFTKKHRAKAFAAKAKKRKPRAGLRRHVRIIAFKKIGGKPPRKRYRVVVRYTHRHGNTGW